jgi:transposase-like protein
MILETAVECARVCRDWTVRQGVTTQWAAAHTAEQRSLAPQTRCNRVHSAATQKAIVIEEGNVNIHAAFLKFASGQLRSLE